VKEMGMIDKDLQITVKAKRAVWEYRLLDLFLRDVTITEVRLNNLGKEGWRLKKVLPSGFGIMERKGEDNGT
jgi:hypothetical protein